MSEVKLGEIIKDRASSEKARKDAIHVAVAPVIAYEDLEPGQHVGRIFDDQFGSRTSSIRVGVVDPFLKKTVKEGERFWLMLYPGTVANLRHEWDHAAFPVEEKEEAEEYEDGCRGC